MDYSLSLIGFDDGYFPPSFKGRRGKTFLVGVKCFKNIDLVGISYTRILVDGLETTDKIIEQAKKLRVDMESIILLDGITYAGFDVADPDRIHEYVEIPVITVQQYPLNLSRIKKALINNFEDGIQRYRVIERIVKKMVFLETPWKTIQYYVIGLPREDAKIVLLRSMIYSPIPEPLRIAHVIASNISRISYRRGLY